jgi:Spy/CpxP family protein refolding chaperone
MDRRMAEMRSRREDMEKKRAAEAALTTPQRLDEMVKHMQDRMAKRQSEMQAHIAAIKQFYAALTPSQQKAFDALHGGMMGGMGHQRGWGRGGMHLGMMDRPSPPMPPMPPQLGMRPSPPPEPPASPGN